MPTGWGGPDPTASTDNNSYELAVEYIANADLTITAVRLWGGPSDVSVPSRQAHIWSAVGTLLGTANLPSVLTAGWATYALTANVTRVAGERFLVSYDTGGNYGNVVQALATAVNSADGNVTAVAASNGTIGGNGSFNTSVGSFPNRASPTNTFYAADFVYTLGIGGPTISNLTVTSTGLTATAVVTATDSGPGLSGAIYRFQWGDSTVTSGSSASAVHTYPVAGVFAVLASVTDVIGLAAFAAQPVDLEIVATGMDSVAIIDAVISLAMATGLFELVNGHEPKNPPATGVSAAVWCNAIDPVKQISGMASSGARLTLNLRLYAPLMAESSDAIDPNLTAAVDTLMATYIGSFTLGGLVRNVDVFGEAGVRLSSKAGYITISGTLYRCVTITVPLLINDAWPEVP